MLSIPPEVNHAINMTEIRESLKSNPTYLLVCIQYEVLEGLPCWDSYKRFCRKFGDDTMDFPEFQFWFMRFYNGETDVEYDRSKEAEKKTIMDLPLKLMTQIAEDYFNRFDIFILSQVSRDFRSFCDTLDSVIELIDLRIEPTGAELSLTNINVLYFPLENGYRMRCRDDTVDVEHGCYLDGIRDALMALSTSKTSTIDELSVFVDSETIDDWIILVGKLSDSLSKSKINVKTVFFEAEDPIHFFPFLDLLTPGYLEGIEIEGSSPDIEIPYQRLAETEQWKQAKKALKQSGKPSNPEYFPLFYHFEQFAFTVKDLTMEFLIGLSDILIASPNFKFFFIYGDFLFTSEQFAARIKEWKIDENVIRSINEGGHVLEYHGGFGEIGGIMRIEKK